VTLLAIDTTGERGSIALVNEVGVMEEVPLHSPDGFGHVLFGEIEALLNRHDLKAVELDGFACASGPGSFTGVRVGLAAAKGLAEATGRQVVVISNLRALASFGTCPLRAVAIDARRGEIYGAVYDSDLRIVQDETVRKLPDWLGGLPQGQLEFVTSGDALTGQPKAAPVVVAPMAIAGALGRIAIGEFTAGRAVDPADVDANYVRRSDAELFWKEV